MSEDEFSKWFRRRFPFFPIFDIDKYFEEMDRYFEDLFKKLGEGIPENLIRERVTPSGKRIREIGPVVYGYSITIGPDGKPKIREFGNIKPSGRRIVEISESREPVVDVIDEDETIRVVAEMPGVEKEDIKLQCLDGKLEVKAERGNRKYYKLIELPADVEPTASKATYKNGILEVILKKKAVAKGKPIKIE
ncbi:MAG: Hsp20/alpha crystallin family protein [Thaumarchaeota archaeon]|nr:Hsp20/alpha crystallin family protein [Nitrososphaerota archaeon]